MSLVAWEQYLERLRVRYRQYKPVGIQWPFWDSAEFKTFVDDLPRDDRIPLLLTAYERYREVPGGDQFLRSAYSLLIDRLLVARLQPAGAEACVILGTACAEAEWDHVRPIAIAERAFRNRAYPADLFDSARAYRCELERLKSPRTRPARDTVDLLLWHDVRQPARGCWSSRVQRAIAAMEPGEALDWQLLLRKAEARLDPDQFFRRVDEWFDFAEGERIRLSFAGSHYLRVLVRHCRQTDRTRSAPILQRLARLKWSKREQGRWESERT